jgi:hypothetical protein
MAGHSIAIGSQMLSIGKAALPTRYIAMNVPALTPTHRTPNDERQMLASDIMLAALRYRLEVDLGNGRLISFLNQATIV